jgi:hypothetical protein
MTDPTPYDRRSPMEHERDNVTPLRKLIEAVEAGDDDLVGSLPRPHALATDLLWKSYQGSLDAAKALHEALLHERVFVELHWSKRYEDEARVSINLGADGWVSASAIPSRAWLIAILRAYEAQQ